MFFDTPTYIYSSSLLNGYVKIQGNIELADKIIKTVQKECIERLNLYEALDYIRNYCVNVYGEEYFYKNAEAITFLVENVYCDLERQKNPCFDKRRYERDIDFGILY